MTEDEIMIEMARLMHKDQTNALALIVGILTAFFEEVVKSNGGNPDEEIRIEGANRTVTLSAKQR